MPFGDDDVTLRRWVAQFDRHRLRSLIGLIQLKYVAYFLLRKYLEKSYYPLCNSNLLRYIAGILIDIHATFLVDNTAKVIVEILQNH